ncbi:MAG: thermonuclease family protein [Atribacterota bacterium]
MSFKVTNVVDGDTFDVTPEWKWNGKTGNRIRIKNFQAPEIDEPGGEAAKRKLENLILEEKVELKDPVSIDRGRLVCDVYLNGKNIVSLLK